MRIVDIEISEDFVMLSVDDRCGMELDETDMAVWLKLEAATEEFIQKRNTGFKDDFFLTIAIFFQFIKLEHKYPIVFGLQLVY